MFTLDLSPFGDVVTLDSGLMMLYQENPLIQYQAVQEELTDTIFYL
jgi:hypothetical protein